MHWRCSRLPTKGGIAMHDVLKDMQVDLETGDLRPNTVSAYLRYARKFVKEIGKPLGEVDGDDVRQ